jgi:hypothetical protein
MRSSHHNSPRPAHNAVRWIIPLMALALSGGAARGQEPQPQPPTPQPQKEHEWLQKFIGEWDMQTELTMQPDQPPLRMDGTESVRAVGPFWIIGESHAEMMGTSFTNVITIGYDPVRKVFVAKSVDSATSHLWTYEGTMDESSGKLTLTWQGPCHMHGGRTMQFRGETEFRSDDHRVFIASVQGDDGEWTQFVVSNFRRKN